jgi:heme-degrading monooxygenase HmoA
MILEHAVRDVIPGEEQDLESAFAEARAIIASMSGFRSLRLDRCIEQPSRYVLLVEWERLDGRAIRGIGHYIRRESL